MCDVYINCELVTVFLDRTGRFYRKINGQNHGTNIVVGKHLLKAYPKKIATYLQLQEPDKYTGHSFRGSGATHLADSGATTLQIKRAGNWHSDGVVEGYVANSKRSKLQLASKFIAGGTNYESTDSEGIIPTGISTTSTSTTYQQIVVNVDMKNARNCTFVLPAPTFNIKRGEEMVEGK